GGLDFYTHHPYGYDMRMFEQTVEGYPGKPVVFTEWGGRSIGQSAVLMEATTEAIGKLVETGRLAGHSFWSWADLPEFSREGEEMVGGILTSGVVTEDRVPRADAYVGLMNLFRRAPRAPEPPSREAQILRPQTVPLSVSSRFTPVSLQKLVDDPAQAQAWSEMEGLLEQFWKVHRFTGRHWEETGRKFWTWNAPQLRLGKMLFETPVREGQTQPVVLTPNRPRVEISVGMPAQRFHFLGNVTLPDGYPVMGKLGNQVGRYVIVYQDGERQEVPLRWGEEVARSNMITIATRIDPATAQGERVIVYSKDPIREVHQTRLLSVDARGKTVARVICELAPAAEEGVPAPPDMHHVTGRNPGPAQQALVLFAITAEQRD
ncbi:MAG: hypothetical protein HY236_17535, partial [Acidobacteria bacterium]|nr:hypothetical protein [Acidobacteriota bacterium]